MTRSMTTIAAVTRPEPVSVYTKAGRPTASSQSPMLLTSPPPSTSRKSRFLHTLAGIDGPSQIPAVATNGVRSVDQTASRRWSGPSRSSYR